MLAGETKRNETKRNHPVTREEDAGEPRDCTSSLDHDGRSEHGYWSMDNHTVSLLLRALRMLKDTREPPRGAPMLSLLDHFLFQRHLI